MASRGTTRFATKADLQAVKSDLRDELRQVETKVSGDIRAVGVVVERMESMMRGLAEGLTATREELKADIRSLEERLSARITVLEEVLRENSRDIRKNSEDIRKNSEDIRKNSEDIRKNSEDIDALRQAVAGLRSDFERHDGKLDGLEARVTEVETRVGIVRE